MSYSFDDSLLINGENKLDNNMLTTDGVNAINNGSSNVPPLFSIDKVQLMFLASDIVSMVVANNNLCLALKIGKIFRIDLDHPESVDDIDLPLPKRGGGTTSGGDSMVDNITSIFLDPTGSHLFITTSQGENFYLNYQSMKPRPLGKLKGLVITSVAWNPFELARSTGEILIGTLDGSIYEAFIEPSNEYFKREDRYVRQVWKNPYGDSISGLYAYQEKGIATRQVLASSKGRIWYWQGKFALNGNNVVNGGGVEDAAAGSTASGFSSGVSLYKNFFESNEPIFEEFESPGQFDSFAISPQKAVAREASSIFGTLNGIGVLHGQLYNRRRQLVSTSSNDCTPNGLNGESNGPNGSLVTNGESSGKLNSNNSIRIASKDIFKNSQIVLYDQLESFLSTYPIRAMTLTEYHIILLAGNHIICVNRLNNQVRYHDKIVTEPNETLIGLCSDIKYATFWAFSNLSVYEIKVGDEEREIWKTLLDSGEYEDALRLVANKDPIARDVVSIAYGEKLLETNHDRDSNKKAAALLGDSSKPFEGVALVFTDRKDFDALQIFLSARLKLFRGAGSKMQRTIIISWMLELFMEQLDSLDDAIAANATMTESTATTAPIPASTSTSTKSKSSTVKISSSKAAGISSTSAAASKDKFLKIFYKFIEEHKADLNKEMAYEIISSHGRRDELLYYASTISDTSFVLSYWIRMEQWSEALKVLRIENDPRLTYKYATVLLVNTPRDTVDTWIRIANLDPKKLIPALLSYIGGFRGDPANNQAIRYLKYAINNLKVKDSVIYNTLISIYASSSSDEAPLLTFLEDHRNLYDYDFALRICNQFDRVQCSVYIFSAMGLYEEAVKLALKKDDIELACLIADKPANDSTLRKSLWLEIAQKVIISSTSQKKSSDSAIDLLNKCDLLKIEDLLPLFPDFTVMDDFRSEVISSMENYSSTINQLNRDMEESLDTANNIKQEIVNFRKRYALVMPGESCAICSFPVATRRFYVFPCQHAFHLDCLLDSLSKTGDQSARSRLAEIQMTVSKKELSNAVDSVLSEKCILCGESRIESIDNPLVSQAEKSSTEWAL